MLKNVFLILSICILFFGCKSSKKTTEYSIVNDEIEVKIKSNEDKNDRIKKGILDNHAYWEFSKKFYIQNMGQVEFLINEFSQDEIAEYIERLEIYFRTTNTDLMFLENFPQLKGLELSGDTIGNIDAIKYLHNLEELKISSPNVVDISPIANLVSLKSLSLLYTNNINDISPIANLNSLKKLVLWSLEKVSDISAISNLENLEDLDISYMHGEYYKWDNIVNFNPIFDIIGLKRLTLNFNMEKDITNIGKLQNLEQLDISINSQTEFNSLSNLTKLRVLNIYYGFFDDVSPLLKLPNLEKIDFGGRNFVDIAPLAASNSLKEVRMDFGPERWYKFQDNEGKIFKEKGIDVDPYDWR
jgi:Leucine-rich repeat (LRR) protein